MDYLIEYLGIGGMDESITHTGDIASLAECIDWIEGSGGQSVSSTNMEDGSVIYESGGFVVQEISLDTGIRGLNHA